SKISRFGLLEMSRQRMRPSLGDSTQITCPRCKGQGTIRNVESVALSVLRLIEEEAMKKGTEKVIAHLPIECATFLLNEKRSAIEQIENRLTVGIIILPSKHLETPAYDIDRIKEKDANDEKPSYLQIKAEDITVPEFAQQLKPKTERPAIKEFLPDSPEPIQNKNEAASLIRRFWHKLVTSIAIIEPEVKDTATPVIDEDIKSTDENPSDKGKSYSGRKRNNNRNKNYGREREQNQTADSEQSQEPSRPPRHPRGPGRNVRPNLPPVVSEVKIEPVKSEPIPETVSIPEAATSEEQIQSPVKKNNSRRGPNRRRPRNPNYKKPDPDNENGNANDAEPPIGGGEEYTVQLRSYAGDFAERLEKIERTESEIFVEKIESSGHNGPQRDAFIEKTEASSPQLSELVEKVEKIALPEPKPNDVVEKAAEPQKSTAQSGADNPAESVTTTPDVVPIKMDAEKQDSEAV
ncbi:MAG: ribonuclease E/G, partial [Methylovulum sp.]|nr:ribonuclease E/G [Methylovulum sp.]